jgi:phosphoribosyl-AMP cyclohydrolase
MTEQAPVLDAQEALTLARFGADGLLPAVIQEASTRQVLMVGYMDREALRRTLTEGRVVFWSRSRQEYWRKGDTSGHVQHVRGAALDCDADALLVEVDQVGPACHTGAHACFDTHPIDALTTDRTGATA